MTAIPILTKREIQIVNLIVFEYSTKDIAKELLISTETVKTHRKNLFSKLDVVNVAGIVREAFVQKLIDYQTPKAFAF